MPKFRDMSKREVFLHYRKNERQKLSRLRAGIDASVSMADQEHFLSLLDGYVNNLVQRVRAEEAWKKTEENQ